MGTELIGRCKCGCEGKVYIASGRSNHGKIFKFPHYCDACSSLISIDMLGNEHSCPKCGSNDIHSYQATTKSLSYKSLLNRLPSELLKKAGYHLASEVHDESFCYPINKRFPLLRGFHHCPQCKEESLSFITSMLYD